MARQDTRRPAQLERLINAVMMPLPDEEVADLEMGRLERKVRAKAFGRARTAVRLGEALHDLAFARRAFEVHHRRKSSDGGPEPDEQKAWEIRRVALAEMILTPASSVDDLKFKRSRSGWSAIPLPVEEIARAIAADEAFLAARPTRRSRKDAVQ